MDYEEISVWEDALINAHFMVHRQPGAGRRIPPRNRTWPPERSKPFGWILDLELGCRVHRQKGCGQEGLGFRACRVKRVAKATLGMSRVEGIGFLASEFGVEVFSVWGICPRGSRSIRRKLAEKSAT